MRVGNPAASRLDESSGKALNADHDNQAELRDLTVSTHFSFEIVRPEAEKPDGLNSLLFRDSERPEAEGSGSQERSGFKRTLGGY